MPALLLFSFPILLEVITPQDVQPKPADAGDPGGEAPPQSIPSDIASVWQDVSRRRAELGRAREVLVESPILWQDGHVSSIQHVAFSPDGHRLVSAGTDQTVRLWDARAGVPLATLGIHSAQEVSASFSDDGERVLVLDRLAWTASVWDGWTGRPYFSVEDHMVRDAVLGAGGRVLVTVDEGGVLRFLDEWGTVTHELDAGQAVESLRRSADGEQLLTCEEDRRVRLRDGRTGAIIRELGETSVRTMDAAFLEDGRLLTRDQDDTTRVWPLDRARPPLMIPGGRGVVQGDRVATVNARQELHLWDATSGQHIATLLESTSNLKEWLIADRYLAATHGTSRSVVGIWETLTGARVGTVNSRSTVHAFAWDPEGRLAIGNFTGSLVVTSQDLRWTSFDGHVLQPNNFEVHATGEVAVQFRGTGAIGPPPGPWAPRIRHQGRHGVRTWDSNSGHLTGRLPRDGSQLVLLTEETPWLRSGNEVRAMPTARVSSALAREARCRASTDGLRLARTMRGGRGGFTAQVFTPAGEQLFSVSGLVAPGNEMELCPAVLSSEYLLTPQDDHSIRVWDRDSGSPVRALLGHRRRIRHLAVSANDYLVSGSEDRTARLWDLQTLEEVAVVRHDSTVWSAALNHDGNLFASGAEDGSVGVHDVSGVELFRAKEHGALVRSLVFSSDSRQLLSCSYDGTGRIWNVGTGEVLHVLRGHTAGIRDSAYTRDCTRIITLGLDSTLRVWDAGSGALLGTRVEYADAGWLTFTPAGYYVAGGNAAEWARVQVDGRSYPLHSYAEILEDPERVKASLAGQELPRPVLPAAPTLVLSSEPYGEIVVPQVEVQGTIQDAFDITEVEVLRNGERVSEEELLRSGLVLQENQRQVRLNLRLGLPTRKDEVVVRLRAKNRRDIWSDWASLHRFYRPAGRDLYLLAIGVQDYEDPSLDLAAPQKDVADLVERFQQEEGGLYQKVHHRVLLNDQVTHGALQEAMETFLYEAGREDTILVFVSGHGVLSPQGRYYFLTPSATTKNPYGGISRDTIHGLVRWDGIASTRRVLLLDTCHAGQDLDPGRRGVRLAQDMFDRDEVQAELEGNGLYIVAGSTEVGFATEADGNGVFTRALLLGLAGEADTEGNGDGIIDVKEWIDHAERTVETLEGPQRVTTPEILGGSPFPVARVPEQGHQRRSRRQP